LPPSSRPPAFTLITGETPGGGLTRSIVCSFSSGGGDGEEAAQQGPYVHHADGVGDRMGRRQAEGGRRAVQAPPLLLLRVTTLPYNYVPSLVEAKIAAAFLSGF